MRLIVLGERDVLWPHDFVSSLRGIIQWGNAQMFLDILYMFKQRVKFALDI